MNINKVIVSWINQSCGALLGGKNNQVQIMHNPMWITNIQNEICKVDLQQNLISGKLADEIFRYFL